FQPHITDEDRSAVDVVLRSGWIGPGEKVEEFEELLCQATGKNYAVCCNSGTTALMLAIKLTLTHTHPFRDVAVPAYGMRAAHHVALWNNAEVRVYDIEQTRNEYPLYISVALNHNGLPRIECDIDIEDACQSMGVSGAFSAPLAVTSFSPQKLVTAGQGGAVVTDD